MKRLFVALFALLFCFSLVSCDGIGDETVAPEVSLPIIDTEILPTEGGEEVLIDVDWSDFIRVEGVIYDGGFRGEKIDESMVGARIGAILYNVKNTYASREEFEFTEYMNFCSAFRPIGSELFEVKWDGNSIAVLDGGEYYLYTRNAEYPRNFKLYGGENYHIPGLADNGAWVFNDYSELCDAWGGAENIPEEIKMRYENKNFDDTTLVIVKIVANNGAAQYGISSVSKTDSNICVEAARFESSGEGDEALHDWTFFIEIAKTDIDRAVVSVEDIEPLKLDSELGEISYEDMSEHIQQINADLSVYDNAAVTSKEAAIEIVRDSFSQQKAVGTVLYDHVRNYWFVDLLRDDGSNVYGATVVIRAADGKIISGYYSMGSW